MRKILSALVIVLLLIPLNAFAADKIEVTTVILVRHGETDYNRQRRFQGLKDMPLNETGINQARLLAERLKDVQIDVFISSPMRRAVATTKAVAELHNMPIAYTDERLVELNYGDWAGEYKADIAEQYPKLHYVWKNKPHKMKFPNGETLKQVQARYRAALDEAVAKYPGKTIFIGAHSKGNMALLCELFDVGLDHFYFFPQDNTCINVLQYEGGKWHVVLLNSVDHLGYVYEGEHKRAA